MFSALHKTITSKAISYVLENENWYNGGDVLNDNVSDTQNSKTWIIFHYNMEITVSWKVCYQVSVVYISCLVEFCLGCTQSGA
jgi:homospermidine synthase